MLPVFAGSIFYEKAFSYIIEIEYLIDNPE